MASQKTTRKKKLYGPYKGYYPQKYLYEYLKIEIDPYDMPNKFLWQWSKEAGVKVNEDDFADVLTPEQLKDYEKWLIDNDKGIKLVTDDPAGAPAYLTLSWPEKMRKGLWAIHFTNEDPFDAFSQGATIPRLALSTWWEKKEQARCPENISDQLGTYEYVYIFAFDALDRGVINRGSKYGKNAVLFQTDAAVKAYHSGDDENQLIIPVCSEYNMIPLNLHEGEITCAFKSSVEGEGLTFDMPKDLIDYVEQAEARGERPLARLEC